VYRLSPAVQALAKISSASSLLVGAELNFDRAKSKDASLYGFDAATFYDGSRTVGYEERAAFLQYELDTRYGSLALGGRYQHHSLAGAAFVPRIAATKAWQNVHVKALYSQAFRTPNINVIRGALDTRIDPERTTSYETEVGYQFGERLFLVADVFHVSIEDIIVYTVLSPTSFGYHNHSQVSSYGSEAELRYAGPRFGATLGYSYYRAAKNAVPAYNAGDKALFLGIPAHKGTASVTLRPTAGLSLNVNGSAISTRRGFRFPGMGIETFAPEILINAFAEYRKEGLIFGLGVSDVLDERRLFLQPYNGGGAPLPGKGREIFFRLGWER